MPTREAWKAGLEQYVTAMGKREHEDNVIIDTEKKSVMSLDDALKSNELDLTDGDTVDLSKKDYTVLNDDDSGLDKKQSSVEDFKLGESVKINVIEPKDTEKKERKDLLSDMKHAADTGKKNSQHELDAAKAVIEAVKGIEKYETDAEVATLCNTDVISLEKLPIVPLVNRILKSHFAKIFMAGWVAKCKDIPQLQRLSKAQKHIRVLKGLTSIVGSVLEEEVSEKKTNDWFKTWADSKLTGEITSKTLKDIFNAGDLRDNNALDTVLSALEKAEH